HAEGRRGQRGRGQRARGRRPLRRDRPAPAGAENRDRPDGDPELAPVARTGSLPPPDRACAPGAGDDGGADRPLSGRLGSLPVIGAEPDWRRLPGLRDVTRSEWESVRWQRANSVRTVRGLKDAFGQHLSDGLAEEIER